MKLSQCIDLIRMEKCNIRNIDGELKAERWDFFGDERRFGYVNKKAPLKYTNISIHSKIPEDGLVDGMVAMGYAASEANHEVKVEMGLEYSYNDLVFVITGILEHETIKWKY